MVDWEDTIKAEAETVLEFLILVDVEGVLEFLIHVVVKRVWNY